jgi:hypothetical protein
MCNAHHIDMDNAHHIDMDNAHHRHDRGYTTPTTDTMNAGYRPMFVFCVCLLVVVSKPLVLPSNFSLIVRIKTEVCCFYWQ